MSCIKYLIWIGLGLAIVMALMVGSVSYGITSISPAEIYYAFTAFDGSREHLIIVDTRVPRAIIALAVGTCLAVSGVIMQALTRNPLAAPEILGINHGAALCVTIGSFVFNAHEPEAFTWLAFLGAGVTAIIVFTIGSFGAGGPTPLKLTLAGAALTTLCASFIRAIMILHERTLDEMRIWLAGSVVGRDLVLFQELVPYMLSGLFVAVCLGKPLNILVMGRDIAVGLGQRPLLIQSLGILSVIILAGSSVAIAGPIAFIGLAVPHMVRSLIGTDYRWVIPCSAVLGSALLLSADIAARFALDGQELPVGVMTALIGVPFFIYLARSGVYKL